MTLKQAIKITEHFQKWRRDRNVPARTKMPDPTKIGEAIDVLLIAAKDYLTIYDMDRVKITTKNKTK